MTRKQYTPRPFAPLAMDLFANQERCALWAKPGMGKTVMTATFLDYLHNVWGEDEPTLVLAPLRVARDGWATECAKWEHLRGLEIVPVTGTAEARAAALRREAPVYATNYENLVWLVDHFKQQRKAWPFKRVVADEATKLKGFRLRQGGVRAQALGQVAHTLVEGWINLTGTPASNGLQDLWGQTWFLDEGQRLGRTYSGFEDRWFRQVRNDNGYSKRVAMEHTQDEIQSRLADICLTLDPRDWFDIKEPVVNVIDVILPPSARIKYDEFEKELFLQLDEGDIEAFNAAGKTMKCLQLANGAAYLDPEKFGEGTWVDVHDEKLDAVEELVNETADRPLLIAYHFKPDLAKLQKRFPEALNLSRADHMAMAKSGKGKVWLGHPQSMGHGVDGLQDHCTDVVFFAQWWNLEEHDQIIERVGPMRQYQAGNFGPMFVHYIIAKGTVDELVMLRRHSKRETQELLMDYMKARK